MNSVIARPSNNEWNFMNLLVSFHQEKCTAHSRSWLFRHLDADQDLPPFSQFGALCDEAQSAKVHVSSRDDRNESLVLILQVVFADIRLETRQSESTRGLRDRTCF